MEESGNRSVTAEPAPKSPVFSCLAVRGIWMEYSLAVFHGSRLNVHFYPLNQAGSREQLIHTFFLCHLQILFSGSSQQSMKNPQTIICHQIMKSEA